jgi:hypothetical protein
MNRSFLIGGLFCQGLQSKRADPHVLIFCAVGLVCRRPAKGSSASISTKNICTHKVLNHFAAIILANRGLL